MIGVSSLFIVHCCSLFLASFLQISVQSVVFTTDVVQLFFKSSLSSALLSDSMLYVLYGIVMCLLIYHEHG